MLPVCWGSTRPECEITHASTTTWIPSFTLNHLTVVNLVRGKMFTAQMFLIHIQQSNLASSEVVSHLFFASYKLICAQFPASQFFSPSLIFNVFVCFWAGYVGTYHSSSNHPNGLMITIPGSPWMTDDMEVLTKRATMLLEPRSIRIFSFFS